MASVEEEKSELKLKTLDDAIDFIRKAKEPFWGNMIKTLYLAGFTVDEMQMAFKGAHQDFKWSGQICIWFQESRPTCIEQVQFANGYGRREYVTKVIEKLIKDNCTPKPEEEKQPQQPMSEEQKQVQSDEQKEKEQPQKQTVEPQKQPPPGPPLVQPQQASELSK